MARSKLKRKSKNSEIVRRVDAPSQMEFVQGRRDGIKRRCWRLPYRSATMDKFRRVAPFSTHHCPVMLELTPGHWVEQIVNESFIQQER